MSVNEGDLESIVPMVNRWLEGVHSAMKSGVIYRSSDIEDEVVNVEIIGEAQRSNFNESFSTVTPRAKAVLKKANGYGQDLIKGNPHMARFLGKSYRKYLDVNHNTKKDEDSADGATLPRIQHSPPQLMLLSTEDIPLNFECDTERYDETCVLRFPLEKRENRASFDSNCAQRPFSPTSTASAMEQLSLGEEEIIGIGSQLREVAAQRRASDGMINRRLAIPWTPSGEVTKGLSTSTSDISGVCRSRPNRPPTPQGPPKGSKVAGRLRLPSLQAPDLRRRTTNEVPEILVSDDSDSNSSDSVFYAASEGFCPSPPRRIDVTLLTASEEASVVATRNAHQILHRRRGSLPVLMSAMRRSGLPMVEEEKASNQEGTKPSMAPAAVSLKVPRHRARSRSLDGHLGTAAQWEQYKMRADKSGKELYSRLIAPH